MSEIDSNHDRRPAGLDVNCDGVIDYKL